MFASLKPWMDVPFTIRPFLKRDGAGTKLFDIDKGALCYPIGDYKLVTDSAGSEVVSTSQLYVEGATAIKVTDNVIFNGEERPILHIASYYRNGVEDIKVVYL